MWGADSFIRAAGGGGAAAALVAQHLGSKSAPCSPVKPFQKRAPAQPDSFHVIHKVPLGDSPYVKAKHVQLVDKDPDAAIALFWAAINAGDRVDSALKDMAIVMKQQNRPEEAIEAIKSLRYRCSDAAQESLDNVLLDLYKRCGRLDDQVALLKHKLHLIHQGMAFNGKRTKTARSQGKKFQVSIEQEATRLLGNLGWAYMQQSNFLAAEAVYRKALSIGPDNNKVCNLGICLMKQGRLEEARAMLQSVVPACPDTRWGSDSHLKSYERAQEMLVELESSMGMSTTASVLVPSSTTVATALSQMQSSTPWLAQPQGTAGVHHHRQKSSNTSADEMSLESIVQFSLPSMAGALSATAGFGPSTNSGPTSGAQKKPVTTTSSLGYQQQVQDRLASQDGGRSGPGLGGASNDQFGRSYHRRSASYQWDDYDLGYTSPDENVDTNVQQGGMGSSVPLGFHHHQHNLQSAQQHLQRSGEGPRQKPESLRARKLERSLTFGALSRMDSNSYNNNSNYAYPAGAALHRAASEKFTAKTSTSASPMKPLNAPVVGQQMPGERAPLTTYDLTNSVTTYAAAAAAAAAAAKTGVDEGIMGATKHVTSGWSNTDGGNHHHSNNKMSDLIMGTGGASGHAVGAPLKSPLGNSELSFFSRWRYNENRPATRRSLSLESFDTHLEQIALENEEVDVEVDFPQPLPSYLQLNLHPPQAPVATATACGGGAAGGHVKRPRNQTPVKEKTSSGNSLWSSMGFSLCPDALNGGGGLKLGLGLGLGLGQQPQQPHYDSEEIRHMNSLVSQVVSDGTASPASTPAPVPTFTPDLHDIVQKIEQQQQSISVSTTAVSAVLIPPPGTTGEGTAASASGSDTEMIKRQRRLRVFQEMTLFPGSPQHVGV